MKIHCNICTRRTNTIAILLQSNFTERESFAFFFFFLFLFHVGQNNAQFNCHFDPFAVFPVVAHSVVRPILIHIILSTPCMCVCLCVRSLRWAQYINRQIEFDVLQLFTIQCDTYYYFICISWFTYIEKLSSCYSIESHRHYGRRRICCLCCCCRRHFLTHKNRIITQKNFVFSFTISCDSIPLGCSHVILHSSIETRNSNAK